MYGCTFILYACVTTLATVYIIYKMIHINKIHLISWGNFLIIAVRRSRMIHLIFCWKIWVTQRNGMFTIEICIYWIKIITEHIYIFHNAIINETLRFTIVSKRKSRPIRDVCLVKEFPHNQDVGHFKGRAIHDFAHLLQRACLVAIRYVYAIVQYWTHTTYGSIYM